MTKDNGRSLGIRRGKKVKVGEWNNARESPAKAREENTVRARGFTMAKGKESSFVRSL